MPLHSQLRPLPLRSDAQQDPTRPGRPPHPAPDRHGHPAANGRRTLLTTLLVALVASLIVVASHATVTRAQPAPSRAAVVRAGYDRLLSQFVDPLSAATVLTEAWQGAVAVAVQAGITELPSLGELPSDPAGAWTAFAYAFAALERAAGNAISSEQLAYAALNAMTAARRDCHTYFLPPESYRRFRDQLEGRARVTGIGIQATTMPPYMIINVLPGTPAARAGLAPGDIIETVDGLPTAALSSSALSNAVRGAPGTSVTLTVTREGEPDPLSFTITRALVTIPTVSSSLRPDGVGVVTLTTFAPDGSSERLLREALLDLEARGAAAWVLDLRGNTGGAVQSVLNVVGLFFAAPVTAVTVETRARERTRLVATGEPLPVQRPLAVLVSPASASGSEILAAVMQDTGRAAVFGQRTAACVNIGTLMELGDGSAIVVTSARVLAGPRERVLEGVGITPDQEVRPGTGDAVLRAAVESLLSAHATSTDPPAGTSRQAQASYRTRSPMTPGSPHVRRRLVEVVV